MQRLLPEWWPQYAVMLTWPHPATDWAEQLEAVEQTYLSIAQAVTRFEKLIVVCHDESVKDHVAWLMAEASIAPESVTFAIAPCNDTWARDHGPITVKDGEIYKLLDFKFNAWGAKYQANLDNEITHLAFNQGVFPQLVVDTQDWVLEGGSIETNGQGLMLTTSQCVLAKSRNGKVDKQTLEQQFKDWFGCDTTLWLDHGALAGDDTDAHIDTLARFTDEDTIAYVACHDKNDVHYANLQAMEAQLKQHAQEHNLKLAALPWPTPIWHEEQRLPATYANFLIINNAVLVPTYQVPQDEEALTIFNQLFPTREVIAIDCRALIKQFGSLHCVTMQIPQIEAVS